jgi:predicted transcriptional regulator
MRRSTTDPWVSACAGGGSRRRKVAKTRLSRREREVMEIVHRAGPVSAADIRAAMEDPPTDGAVRSTLRILVDKGHLSYEADGPRYLYFPTVASQDAGRSALDRLMHTFFDGSRKASWPRCSRCGASSRRKRSGD